MGTLGLVPRFSTFLRAPPCPLHPGFKTGPPPAARPPGTDRVCSAPSPLPLHCRFFLCLRIRPREQQQILTKHGIDLVNRRINPAPPAPSPCRGEHCSERSVWHPTDLGEISFGLDSQQPEPRACRALPHCSPEGQPHSNSQLVCLCYPPLHASRASELWGFPFLYSLSTLLPVSWWDCSPLLTDF